MEKEKRVRVVVLVAVTSLLGGIFVTGGCAAQRSAVDVRLPDNPQLVGGGMMIEWKARQPGTVYLVERRTGKLVETRSLEPGEVFSFSATSIVQADEFEQMLGIRFGNAHFLLYFQPLDANAGPGAPAETSESGRNWSRT